ncbi:hypothetical protein CN544_30755 [Bacillus toyonensis]|nr:hypothetical protein CN539_30625 [Bacillus toyonensis]PEN75387.1 hypothetical protein CN544_30755 [Bacillus toyonensis]QWH48250.1 hypothetical protein EXW64_28470 [Bacillus toyonensis]
MSTWASIVNPGPTSTMPAILGGPLNVQVIDEMCLNVQFSFLIWCPHEGLMIIESKIQYLFKGECIS